jgi:hypothetical protein
MCTNPQNTPEYVLLDVPYFDQKDNTNQPGRSVQVTAVASVLAFYGVQPKSNDRSLPDEVIVNVQQYGDIIEHAAIAKAVTDAYKVNIKFTTNATWCEVVEALRNGMPVVAIGMFGTVSGHVVTIVGYTPTHVLVHDSYGNAMTRWSEPDGRNMLYPIKDVMTTLAPESEGRSDNIWAYFISP